MQTRTPVLIALVLAIVVCGALVNTDLPIDTSAHAANLDGGIKYEVDER